MTATATPVKPCTARTKTRTARYRHIKNNLGTLDMTIASGEKVEEFNYFVEDLGHDADDTHGSARVYRCFRLTKHRAQQQPGRPDHYDVMVDMEATEQRAFHHCECLGHIRWGRCKHPTALLALIQAGKL